MQNGKLLYERIPEQAATIRHAESYSYDIFKRVQSVTRTMDGRSYATSYQYTSGNQLTEITYPSQAGS